jgi:hypothetical protein
MISLSRGGAESPRARLSVRFRAEVSTFSSHVRKPNDLKIPQEYRNPVSGVPLVHTDQIDGLPGAPETA